jgi:hypothetical protein
MIWIAPSAKDAENAAFNKRLCGSVGRFRTKAHQLFGEQLPALRDELNEVLAA